MADTQHEDSSETKGDRRRRHLMTVASECFGAEGFRGTSMSRISQASGMSPGHIYHYFPTKEAMIETIVADESHYLGELVRSVEEDEEGGALLERLMRQTPVAVAHCRDPAHSGLLLEIVAEAARNPSIGTILKRSDADVAQEFFELFCRIGRPTEINDADLRLRMELVAAIYSGIVMRAQFKPDLDQTAMVSLINEVLSFLFGDTR